MLKAQSLGLYTKRINNILCKAATLKELHKIHDSFISTTHSARNLGFIFNKHLIFYLLGPNHCTFNILLYHIREIRCIRLQLDFKQPASLPPPSSILKNLYCHSLYHNLPNCQLKRLQQIQNSLAHAVAKAPKSTHITPILKIRHWLKVYERIKYKLSLTYKVLTTAQPAPHLLSLFLARHLLGRETISSLKITDRSLRYASSRRFEFRQPHQSCLDSPPLPLVNPSLIIPALIIHHSFTLSFQAQNLPFQQILRSPESKKD